jgi:hypothetical protein
MCVYIFVFTYMLKYLFTYHKYMYIHVHIHKHLLYVPVLIVSFFSEAFDESTDRTGEDGDKGEFIGI